MKYTIFSFWAIFLMPLITLGQLNIIGEYSTIHKYSWGSGLELTLKSDSTFSMSNYQLNVDTPIINETITGHWSTKDSTRWLILYQNINDTLQLIYNFPFIDYDRMLTMTCKDSSKTKEIINANALKFYPMVLYKLKGFYPSGQLESELPRRISENPDDCPVTDIWKYYYSNGILKEEIDYSNSQSKSGLIVRKKYYENGEIKSFSQWKNKLKDGEWKEYNEQGSIVKTLVYKKDKLKK